MEDMIGPLSDDEIRASWYQSPVRKGVIDDSPPVTTDAFKQWCAGCEGRVVILQNLPEANENPARLRPYSVYFEKQTDHAVYLLTFDEVISVLWSDAAAFYAPYIPLTISGVSPCGPETLAVKIVTRYNYDQVLAPRRKK